MAVQGRLDGAYDCLAGTISDDLWTQKSDEWARELQAIRRESIKHERASKNYTVTGGRILELAKKPINCFFGKIRRNRRHCSNPTFELHVRSRKSFSYVKPFDLLVEGNETGDWLGGRDSNPDNRVQSVVIRVG